MLRWQHNYLVVSETKIWEIQTKNSQREIFKENSITCYKKFGISIELQIAQNCISPNNFCVKYHFCVFLIKSSLFFQHTEYNEHKMQKRNFLKFSTAFLQTERECAKMIFCMRITQTNAILYDLITSSKFYMKTQLISIKKLFCVWHKLAIALPNYH